MFAETVNNLFKLDLSQFSVEALGRRWPFTVGLSHTL